ncbi:MAG: hypothetical protein IJT76_00195 [Clostridia bacterium]|nr:hypothetical protein [Clostridia bacterium]
MSILVYLLIYYFPPLVAAILLHFRMRKKYLGDAFDPNVASDRKTMVKIYLWTAVFMSVGSMLWGIFVNGMIRIFSAL